MTFRKSTPMKLRRQWNCFPVARLLPGAAETNMSSFRLAVLKCSPRFRNGAGKRSEPFEVLWVFYRPRGFLGAPFAAQGLEALFGRYSAEFGFLPGNAPWVGDSRLWSASEPFSGRSPEGAGCGVCGHVSPVFLRGSCIKSATSWHDSVKCLGCSWSVVSAQSSKSSKYSTKSFARNKVGQLL